MKDVLRYVTIGAFYVLALVLVVWSGSLTLELMSKVLPGDEITKFFALALFDGGALTWLLVFLFFAQGLPQRAVSLAVMALDLLGVFGMVLADLLLSGQQLASIPDNLGSLVVYGVSIMTAVNVAAVYIFHIGEPGNMANIELRTEQDKLQSEALTQARARLQSKAASLGARLADRLESEALYNLRLLDDVPALPEPAHKVPGAFSANGKKPRVMVYEAESVSEPVLESSSKNV